MNKRLTPALLPRYASQKGLTGDGVPGGKGDRAGGQPDSGGTIDIYIYPQAHGGGGMYDVCMYVDGQTGVL